MPPNKLFKSEVCLLIFLAQSMCQASAVQQYLSHVRLLTPAFNFAHGVGNPINVPDLYDKLYSFRSFRMAPPNIEYVREVPVVSFNDENGESYYDVPSTVTPKNSKGKPFRKVPKRFYKPSQSSVAPPNIEYVREVPVVSFNDENGESYYDVPSTVTPKNSKGKPFRNVPKRFYKPSQSSVAPPNIEYVREVPVVSFNDENGESYDDVPFTVTPKNSKSKPFRNVPKRFYKPPQSSVAAPNIEYVREVPVVSFNDENGESYDDVPSTVTPKNAKVPPPNQGYVREVPVVSFDDEDEKWHDDVAFRDGRPKTFKPLETADFSPDYKIIVLPPSPYKVDSPDPESLWPLSLIHPSNYAINSSQDTELLGEESVNRSPYFLNNAERAIMRAQRQGPFYFSDFPHIRSLKANEKLRLINNLPPHRWGSLRYKWSHSRV